MSEFRFDQQNVETPCLFLPWQYVITERGQIGCVVRKYSTEECGHAAPYQHIYEVSLAAGYKATFYEFELFELEYTRVKRDV